MNELNSLYIERNNCGDCYRCVRECVVKAISLNSQSAEILPQMCINCGNCLSACPNGVIKVRNDVWQARALIKNNDHTVCSLDPIWITEFPGVKTDQIVEALKLLGFAKVSESSLGAEKTINQELTELTSCKGVSISSRCPAVNDFIQRYRPTLSGNILKVETPMHAHGSLIKKWWGQETKIVHISSCPAAKDEAEKEGSNIDIVLTFGELKSWLNDEGITFDKIPGHDSYQFEPVTATRGLLYGVLRGGVNAGELKKQGLDHYTYIGISSMKEIERVLNQIPTDIKHDIYLDLLACSNGCIGSCCSTETKTSIIEKQVTLHRTMEQRAQADQNYTLPDIDVRREAFAPTPINTSFMAESETQSALESLGIDESSHLINCDGCGYVTCRRFAKALSRGLVDKQMCTHYVRTELRDKFSTLMEKITSGVMFVDADMTVVEANRNIASMLGTDIEMIYDENAGLNGMEISKIAPFHKMLATLLNSGDESAVKDIQIKDKMLNVAVYVLNKRKTLLVLIRNMIYSQVRNDEIVTRTQKVIRDNLSTVQKIAYLLGENASRTEAILNSILESQEDDNAQ